VMVGVELFFGACGRRCSFSAVGSRSSSRCMFNQLRFQLYVNKTGFGVQSGVKVGGVGAIAISD
jgi:hypothetical protein